MSHVATIDTEFKDLEALRKALAELGCTFKENQKTFRWYGRWVNDYDAKEAAYRYGIKPEDYGKCDHAVEVPGSGYDIGLVKNKETGAYRPLFDFWGTGRKILEVIGDKGERLKQRYSLIKCELLAKQRGLRTVREQHPDRIRLRAFR